MNQINQMNMMQNLNPMIQMNQMVQNNNINPMNNINLINQMNNMNYMNNMNNMNNLNYINNMNNMNNMNVINNMNNMNGFNPMNQNNDINKREDNDPLNLMSQINQIIQMNPILTIQNKEIISQLFQLYQSIIRVNQILGVSKIEDEFPEIKEPKKCIYFINNNNGKRFGILIPYSLKSKKLYSIAKKYKLYKYSDLKLFYKNNYLREDETPIDLISFGDEINIVEDLYDIDLTYYQSYLSKNNKKEMINIMFNFSSGIKKRMTFTLETTVKEMIKMFFFEMRIPEKEKKNFRLIYDASHLDFNDNSTLLEKEFHNLISITVYECNQFVPNIIYKGKKIKAKIYNKEKIISNIIIGTLDTIEQLYLSLEYYIPSEYSKIKKLEIGGKELKKDDKRTFSSIGINNDFICNIEY